MRALFAAPAIASALSLLASSAFALGLGQVTNATRLGQPLDFSVIVKLDADEAVAPQCVMAEVTAGDHRLPSSQVQARLRRGARGETVAHVATSSRLNEPVVTVALSLGCPPRLTHKFVSLLDPPLSQAARAAFAPSALTRADLARRASDAAPAASDSAPAASDSAPGLPDAGQRVRDRELLLGLEERLERQRQENQATQQTLAALQAKLRESEQARREDPAIYGLWTLVVLLFGTVVVLVWRLMTLQKQTTWKQEAKALSEFVARPSKTGREPATPSFDEATLTSMKLLSEPSQLGAPEPPARPAPPARETAQTTIPAAARVQRELSADELIDLEQQADFFMALGQEDAAIDLLMGHVRSSGGTSPMPYIKLLDIYRRRSDGDAYERIRERFDRRFNARAPSWESDPRQARALDTYPPILDRLQAAWPTPVQAIELLQSLLFRRDASDQPFELPAYDELLFLYAIARDVHEHTTSPEGVDLLLPLGEAEETSIVRREASRPPEAWMRPPSTSVDVDLDLGVPPHGGAF